MYVLLVPDEVQAPKILYPNLDSLVISQNCLVGIVNPVYIRPITYGSLIDCLIKCESGNNPYAWNKKDPRGGSKGILQFQKPTFYYYAEKIGITNPDIWNVEQQMIVADYIISQGKLYLWTCGEKCGNIEIRRLQSTHHPPAKRVGP